MTRCKCGGAIHPIDQRCFACGRPVNRLYWLAIRAIPWLGASLIGLLVGLVAYIWYALTRIGVTVLVAALALACSGCHSSLVKVDRTYHFSGPVYYPVVTVDKELKAGGIAK